MQCVNIELKWLPCARCTWSIVIYSVCTTWVAACTDERPSGRSKWSLCTRILSFSMSILCAFQCAKCDSVLHKQWANVFHCSNVVSVFPRLPFFPLLSHSHSLYLIYSVFSFFITWIFLTQTHTLHSLSSHSLIVRLFRHHRSCCFSPTFIAVSLCASEYSLFLVTDWL